MPITVNSTVGTSPFFPDGKSPARGATRRRRSRGTSRRRSVPRPPRRRRTRGRSCSSPAPPFHSSVVMRGHKGGGVSHARPPGSRPVGGADRRRPGRLAVRAGAADSGEVTSLPQPPSPKREAGAEVEGEEKLAEAGVALEEGQFAEGEPRRPEPVDVAGMEGVDGGEVGAGGVCWTWRCWMRALPRQSPWMSVHRQSRGWRAGACVST